MDVHNHEILRLVTYELHHSQKLEVQVHYGVESQGHNVRPDYHIYWINLDLNLVNVCGYHKCCC